MKLMNLTPHKVRVLDGDEREILTILPSGPVARVSVTRQQMGVIPLSDDAAKVMANLRGAVIPVFVGTYGEVTDLPASEPGTIYIVSAMVRQAMPHRRDVMSPGELVRGEDGQPVGCRGLEANQ